MTRRPASRGVRWVWPAALAVVALGCGRPPRLLPPQPVAGVPPARLARLERGVNITGWFNAWGRTPPFGDYLSDADLQQIRGLGFRLVRMVVDPEYLWRPARDSLDPAVLAGLDSAIDRLLAHDLAVIVTPYPHDWFLLEDSARAADFARFWEALAGNLGTRDPERIFLEVVNEPVFHGRPEAWAEVQRMLLAAMRRGAPRHTLIATGSEYSSVEGLLGLAPVDDPNVVYTFHFYEPYAFSNQGRPGTPNLGAVPYPADPSRCAAMVARLGDPGAGLEARRYCARRWNGAALGAIFDRMDQWRLLHRVSVFAGEFGATCAAPERDRLAWIQDVHAGLERRGIGWALWGWDDCFGLDAHRGADGRLAPDAGVLAALGLSR